MAIKTTKKSVVSWHVLIHFLPPKPEALRVRVWRALQKIEALPVKNSVYLLPEKESFYNSLLKISQDIKENGGEASLFKAQFGPVDTEKFIEQYNDNLKGHWDKTIQELREHLKTVKKRPRPEELMMLDHVIIRLRGIIKLLSERDVFGTNEREVARDLLLSLEDKLGGKVPGLKVLKGEKTAYHKKIWVTRKDLHVDRLASAWLIKRYIDPEAKFLFVNMNDYRASSNHILFDVHGGHFTHQGELCTFEVLQLLAFSPKSRKISSTIHDLSELKHILDIFLDEVKRGNLNIEDTIIGKLANYANFDFFHNKPDRHNEIKLTYDMTVGDPALTYNLTQYGKRELSESGTFVRGCIRISEKDNTNHD
ncbi:TPA: chromate resistance protein ChrB domain-containing protein [Legionella pneumophila]|nr:chromate resistance protein [Legionella pneumophila]HBD7173652.1 chromate resistance protein [Legionella pneumophila]HCU5989936.1 chromate resistance protein [Legionella pneumophila]HDP7979105.1 chromate resistance protein [Legionella pneumophila]HEM6948548.1 chromate resistance protein [Legionella pneumophila]